jgi:replicative DNA helicase
MQGHGKYSGDLEFAGDTVLAFVPEPWPNPDRPPAEGNTVHLAIAKQRAGKAGWTKLMFDGCQFTEPVEGVKVSY